MRPKGWKLDPAWCDHYDRVERERLERQMELRQIEHQMAMNQASLDRSMRELQRPRPVVAESRWY